MGFNSSLPRSAEARKALPLFSGLIKYFPDALVAVAHCSWVGNEQHNPGTPVHWDRAKSGDELDALTRHLFEAGKTDTDGIRHSAKVAWRALANLQKEIERDRNADDDRDEDGYDMFEQKLAEQRSEPAFPSAVVDAVNREWLRAWDEKQAMDALRAGTQQPVQFDLMTPTPAPRKFDVTEDAPADHERLYPIRARTPEEVEAYIQRLNTGWDDA